MTISDWLWTGTAAMGFGAAVLFVMGFRRRAREEENHFILHLLVCLVAMASYLLMASGHGSIHLSDGRDFYIARYIDWSITTPLLLLTLSLIGVGDPLKRWGVILGLLGTDIYMIVTGLFAGLSPAGSTMKWVWYLVSCGAFVFVYQAIWLPLRAESVRTGPVAHRNYMTAATLLSAVWLGYPFVFLFGTDGTGAIGPLWSGALYTILDIVAKVVIGIVSLANTRAKVSGELRDGTLPAGQRLLAAAPYPG